VLLIDNYDSFVFNLARYLERLGQCTEVVRNTAIDVAGVRALSPDALVLSPGPCAPRQAGCSLDLVRELHGELPILGVCLGHQVIAEPSADGSSAPRSRYTAGPRRLSTTAGDFRGPAQSTGRHALSFPGG